MCPWYPRTFFSLTIAKLFGDDGVESVESKTPALQLSAVSLQVTIGFLTKRLPHQNQHRDTLLAVLMKMAEGNPLSQTAQMFNGFSLASYEVLAVSLASLWRYTVIYIPLS